ncbi:OLC1v1003590C2 [Oldenlandia corymbosa var. corymbosa]|uniref:OLC1v1003590C2 n=1 Tax=Oldenlandia corymbosa var. corymbosa TaxID=529605 RepID=A0AAV1DC88_OLDCO|nr:OLC1v1003590C2 [Oldenlandia corymbosa var. corymbosa]
MQRPLSKSMVGSGGGRGRWLRNRYWILRHGKSIPNEKGLIVSSMENGILAEYELAAQGVDQATLAGHSFKQILLETNTRLENVRLCYSPFSRTTHTAKMVASVLDIPFEGPQCKVMPELRERYFGPSFELKSHDKVNFCLHFCSRFFAISLLHRYREELMVSYLNIICPLSPIVSTPRFGIWM